MTIVDCNQLSVVAWTNLPPQVHREWYYLTRLEGVAFWSRCVTRSGLWSFRRSRRPSVSLCCLWIQMYDSQLPLQHCLPVCCHVSCHADTGLNLWNSKHTPVKCFFFFFNELPWFLQSNRILRQHLCQKSGGYRGMEWLVDSLFCSVHAYGFLFANVMLGLFLWVCSKLWHQEKKRKKLKLHSTIKNMTLSHSQANE